MPLIPDTARLMTTGTSRLFQGLREGDQRNLLVGAGLIAFGWWKKTAPPKKELLYRKTIPMGSTVVVRYGKTGDPKLEITEPDVT